MRPYYSEAGITIFHADCREVLPTLSPVDLVLTDPPYGTGWVRGGGAVGVFKPRLERPDWDVFDLTWLSTASAYQYAVFAPNSRIEDMRQAFGATSTCWYIKSNPRPMGPDREPIVIFPALGADEEFTAYNGDSPLHPCQKPETLIRWLVAKFSAPLILDPFMGSGTTLRAAKDLGRKAIGIEISEEYCRIAVERLKQGTLFSFGSGQQVQQGERDSQLSVFDLTVTTRSCVASEFCDSEGRCWDCNRKAKQ